MFAGGLCCTFPMPLSVEAEVCGCTEGHNMESNILKASITPKEEGAMVLEPKVRPRDYKKGFQCLVDVGAKS